MYEHYARYKRQIMLPEIGEKGQEKLALAKVLVVGAGGLGSPALYYLTALGVGCLGIIDDDVVDISNLNRQILHWEEDLGKGKTISAREKLQRFNPALQLETISSRFTAEKAEHLVSQYDLVVSAVDNQDTRKIINQACYKTGRPWIEGGVQGFTGVVTTFLPPKGPCYECLYPGEHLKRTAPLGVIGTVAGIIGILQAQEALKLILGIGEPLVGKLLFYEALEANFHQVLFNKQRGCPICGKED